MTLDSAMVDGHPAKLTLDETVARVELDRPLEPGDSLTLRLRFDVQAPRPFDRFGHVGSSYSVGQWYPKMVVYDEHGWHPDPYHFFAEFYGDYATFDVAITLPDRYWVGATGVLAHAQGGDNEIPLADRDASRDSVWITVRAIPGHDLTGQWPRRKLEIETDLDPRGERRAEPLTLDREKGGRFRAPRGAPVHYAYAWIDSADVKRREADREGRPGPLRFVLATRDSTLLDTLRALAPKTSPNDSVQPSLKTLRFHAERVHDFGWVASPEYVRADTSWNGIAIRALAFRDDQEDWREQKAFAASAMEYLNREVGPYIYPSFTTAEAYMGGGAMEYPMLIMNEPGLPSNWFQDLDLVVAHELAHNWFYGMLGSDERADPWLDEGFTQYFEERYADWKYPHGLFKKQKRIPWLSPVRDFHVDQNRWLPRALAQDEMPMATSADRYNGWAQVGSCAYAKPAMMLHFFHGLLGDTAFSEFIRTYYRRNLLHHPRPDSVLTALLSTTSDERVPGLFREWVYGTARPGRLSENGTPLSIGHGVTVGGVPLDPWAPRGGDVPPLRFKPLLDFRSSEAMTFFYGPMLWYGRAEGARLGAWTTGKYLPSTDFPEGILNAAGSLVVGTRAGAVSWMARAGRRGLVPGARGRVDLIGSRDAGLFRTGASIGNFITAPGRRHPYRSWQLSLEYRDRSRLAPVDPRYWSLGRAVHGKALFTVDTRRPRRAEHAALDLRAGVPAFPGDGPAAPEIRYERASAELKQTLTLLPRGNARLSWRAFLGSAFRRTPREALFDAAEGSRLDSLDRFYLNDRGPLLASGHYWIEGGGGLRGYRGRAALGKRVWALNLDFHGSFLPVALFADAGRIDSNGLGESTIQSSGSTDLTGRFLADAGVGATFGPVKVTVPFWVSRPESGKGPIRVRWLVSLASIPLSL